MHYARNVNDDLYEYNNKLYIVVWIQQYIMFYLDITSKLIRKVRCVFVDMHQCLSLIFKIFDDFMQLTSHPPLRVNIILFDWYDGDDDYDYALRNVVDDACTSSHYHSSGVNRMKQSVTRVKWFSRWMTVIVRNVFAFGLQ